MARLLALFILLPLAFAFERQAYYGMRATLPLYMMRELGMPSAAISTLLTVSFLVPLFVLLLSAGLLVFVRPSIVLAIGGFVAMLGYAVLALAPGVAGVWFGLGVLGLGQGLLKPAVFTLAARELPHPSENLRNTLFALLYVAINVGALGSSVTHSLTASAGERVSFGFCIGLSVVALVLMLAVLGVDLGLKANPPSERGPDTGKVLAGSGLLVVVFLPYLACSSSSSQLSFQLLASSSVASGMTAIYSVNPLTVVAAGLVLCGAFAILHFADKRPSPFFVIGAGLCLFAAAATPLLLSSPGSTSAWTVIASSAGMAVGEVLIAPLAMSRAFGDVPGRATGAVVAGWLLLTGGGSFAVSALGNAWQDGVKPLAALCIGLCFVVGVATLVLTPLIVRRLYSPGEPADLPPPQ